MTGILGFAELLLHHWEGPERQREWVQRIYLESQRLTSIVADLLNISRIDAGRLTLKLAPLTLAPLFNRVIWQFQSGRGLHSFAMETSPDLPSVMADEDKLVQVLHNLVDNAVKYSPLGGPVTISACRQGDEVVISVADRGMGIPEEHMPRLFKKLDRIWRSETVNIRGTGLGLYIVKSLVELMNGRVWAESAVNQGSTFRVALPAAELTSAKGPASVPKPPV